MSMTTDSGRGALMPSHARLQLWSMGGGVNLWRAAPALYYRMVEEVVRRSVAAHGPPTRRDFDDKLVRGDMAGQHSLAFTRNKG